MRSRTQSLEEQGEYSMSVEQNKALVRPSVAEFHDRDNVDVVDEIYAWTLTN